MFLFLKYCNILLPKATILQIQLQGCVSQNHHNH